jgi:hypothetical protein
LVVNASCAKTWFSAQPACQKMAWRRSASCILRQTGLISGAGTFSLGRPDQEACRILLRASAHPVRMRFITTPCRGLPVRLGIPSSLIRAAFRSKPRRSPHSSKRACSNAPSAARRGRAARTSRLFSQASSGGNAGFANPCI